MPALRPRAGAVAEEPGGGFGHLVRLARAAEGCEGAEVGLEDGVEGLVGDFGEAAAALGAAGVVQGTVESPPPLDRGHDGSSQFAGVGGVGLNGEESVMWPVRDERMDKRVADDGGCRVVVAVVGIRGDGVGDTAQGLRGARSSPAPR